MSEFNILFPPLPNIRNADDMWLPCPIKTSSDELKAVSPWQPIETAPMDYKRYLFITKSGVYAVDRYVKRQEPIHKGRVRFEEAPGDRYTHWMPLPPPPTT